MKTTHVTLTALLLLVIALSGCNKKNSTPMMKNISGRPGEMVVVISKDHWKGEFGTAMFETLAQPQLGLPAEEPLFDITQIPHEAFSDIFLTTRNLIVVNIGSNQKTNEVVYQNNVYAHLQAFVTINANNTAEALSLFKSNTDKILGFFVGAERNRLLYSYERIYEKAVSNTTKDKFGLDIRMIPGSNVVENRDDFMWIRFETPEISQGIFIYTFPYESDSTFTRDYLLAKRNIILKKNVPGPTEGSYMTTDSETQILFNILKKNGNYSSEARGLWKVENDFMGGPFIQFATLDLLNRKVIVIDGYVYAPSKNKRNLLRQVEAMIYSAKFINQAEMDKLNKQFEL
jgi:hypothetical protein